MKYKSDTVPPPPPSPLVPSLFLAALPFRVNVALLLPLLQPTQEGTQVQEPAPGPLRTGKAAVSLFLSLLSLVYIALRRHTAVDGLMFFEWSLVAVVELFCRFIRSREG